MANDMELTSRVAVVEHRIDRIENTLDDKLQSIQASINEVKGLVQRDEGAKGAYRYVVGVLLAVPAAIAVIVSAIWHLIEKR